MCVSVCTLTSEFAFANTLEQDISTYITASQAYNYDCTTHHTFCISPSVGYAVSTPF